MTNVNRSKSLKLKSDDFPEAVRRLIPIIGKNALVKIIKEMGGESIYFPTWQRFSRRLRDKKIRSEFNGRNERELAMKYGFTVNWIRQIVAPKKQ